MWGYLSEFWDAITEVGDYTIEWFESVGNAVAGAIGGLFENLVHHLYDFFYLIWWLADSLKELIGILLKPLIWIFQFGKGFLSVATKTAEELGLETGEIASFNQAVFNLFDEIPYINYIFAGAGAVLGILCLVFIIKKLSTI